MDLGATEVLASEGLDGLLEEVHRLPVAPIACGLLGHKPPRSRGHTKGSKPPNIARALAGSNDTRGNRVR